MSYYFFFSLYSMYGTGIALKWHLLLNSWAVFDKCYIKSHLSSAVVDGQLVDDVDRNIPSQLLMLFSVYRSRWLACAKKSVRQFRFFLSSMRTPDYLINHLQRQFPDILLNLNVCIGDRKNLNRCTPFLAVSQWKAPSGRLPNGSDNSTTLKATSMTYPIPLLQK